MRAFPGLLIIKTDVHANEINVLQNGASDNGGGLRVNAYALANDVVGIALDVLNPRRSDLRHYVENVGAPLLEGALGAVPKAGS